MSASLPVRLLRATVVAGVAVALGAGAHQLGSGLLSSSRALGGLALVLVAVGVVALRAQASLLRLGVLVVGGQGLVHLVLSATAGHTGAQSPAEAGAPAPGRLDAALLHVVAHLAEVPPATALAHVGAAAVVAVWLWHGERTLWTLMRGLLTALCHRWATWSLPGVLAADGSLRPGVSVAAADRGGVPLLSLHGAWSYRGPPLVGATPVRPSAGR